MPPGSMYCNRYCNPSAKGSVEVLGVFLALTRYTADEALPGLRLILPNATCACSPWSPWPGAPRDHLISSNRESWKPLGFETNPSAPSWLALTLFCSVSEMDWREIELVIFVGRERLSLRDCCVFPKMVSCTLCVSSGRARRTTSYSLRIRYSEGWIEAPEPASES